MLVAPDWHVDATRILTKREIATVLADLKRKAARSPNTRMNLVIFGLASFFVLSAVGFLDSRFDFWRLREVSLAKEREE